MRYKGRIKNNKIPGNFLLSQDPAVQVPSAQESLTSVFGMGTGVASPLSSPSNINYLVFLLGLPLAS